MSARYSIDLVAGVELAKQEEAIRDLINQEVPIKTVLRLLCLYSVICGGLKPKVYEDFKRELLQVSQKGTSESLAQF